MFFFVCERDPRIYLHYCHLMCRRECVGTSRRICCSFLTMLLFLGISGGGARAPRLFMRDPRITLLLLHACAPVGEKNADFQFIYFHRSAPSLHLVTFLPLLRCPKPWWSTPPFKQLSMVTVCFCQNRAAVHHGPNGNLNSE